MNEESRIEFDKLMKMELHERLEISDGLIVVRVPGGWIYVIDETPVSICPVFVPIIYELS